jgi:hypothetical protein
VARPGGAVAAYVWDYADKMELIRYFWDAAVVLDPTALEFDEGCRFPICQPSPLADVHSQNLVHHERAPKSSTLLLYRTTRYIIDFYPENKMFRFNVRGVRSIDGATRALFTSPRAATRMA